MTFEDMKKIVVDTLNCEEEKVTMEASRPRTSRPTAWTLWSEHGSGGCFGVSIPDEELANMKTVGDIFNYLTAHAEA